MLVTKIQLKDNVLRRVPRLGHLISDINSYIVEFVKKSNARVA